MMNFGQGKKSLGFTLVELAIVLAVVGVLAAGLYRLISGGNQNVKDSSAASQQAQLISAVKSFLNSSEGGLYMNSRGSGTVYNLFLPQSANETVAQCQADLQGQMTALSPGNAQAITNLPYFCNYLPSGFYTGTVNSYGQVYKVNILNGYIAPGSLSPPTTYSFMIVTQNGDAIPDADGGNISSLIGNEGGFIYGSAACPGTTASATQSIACGSYGGWTQSLGTYNYSAQPVGHIASYSYISPEASSTLPWLARVPYQSIGYNTMSTPFYLGGQIMYLANAGVTNADNTTTPSTGGGTIQLQNGSIQDLSNLTGNTIKISVPSGGAYYLSTASNPFETLGTACTSDTTDPNASNLFRKSDCQTALQVNGDENLTGYLQANVLYSNTFIYGTPATPSDLRLKTDILPLPSELNSLSKMKPVSYIYKDNHIKGLGFIAQDVEKIYPQLVVERPDGMKGVVYEGLIAPLVSAVQELKQQNDELREELKRQSEREDELERKLNKSTP